MGIQQNNQEALLNKRMQRALRILRKEIENPQGRC